MSSNRILRSGIQKKIKSSSSLLVAGFVLMIALICILAMGASNIVHKIAGATEDLYVHPFAVSNAVLEANANIISMHRYMKDVALAQSKDEVEAAISKVDKDEVLVYKNFDIILSRFLGDKSQIEEVRQIFNDWKPIRMEVIELTRDNKSIEAALITKEKGAEHVALLTKKMNNLIKFAENKADEFYLKSTEEEKRSATFLNLMAAITILIAMIISFFVIKKEKQHLRKHLESEDRLDKVIQGASLGYWDWDYQSGDHYVNDRWLEILGHDRRNHKNHIDDWKDKIHPNDKDQLEQIIEKAINEGNSYAAEFRMQHKHGHWVWVQGSGAVVSHHPKTKKPLRLCGVHEDISKRKHMEEELKHLATHDPLTGLYNRNVFEQRLSNEIDRAHRYNHTLSVFMLDIDHFKSVNDTYGHQTGDNVLQLFGKLINNSIRNTDFAGRYGGEEFVIILPETPLATAIELAERLCHNINKYNFPLDGNKELNITASIGVASIPEHAQSSEDLIKAVDSCMYAAKEAGRNQVKSA